MRTYLLRDILRDAIETAKEAGIWQPLSLREKEDLVRYFLTNYPAIMEEASSMHTVPCDLRERKAA